LTSREQGINVRVFGNMTSADLWLRLGSPDDHAA